MLLTNEDLSAEGLGAVFAIFLGVLVALRVATKARSRFTRHAAFTAAWVGLTVPPALRVLSGAYGHKDSYKYKLQFLSDAGAAGVPMARTGTAGASEPLYLLLIRGLRMVTNDSHVFFTIAFGIIAFGFVYFIAHTVRAHHSILPLLLIFPSWLHAFSAVRNWMAIALLLVGLTWYLRKRTRWFYAWVAIATGFHFSAAIFFAFPFFIWLLFRRRGIAWTALVLAFTNAVAFGSSSILSSVLAGTRYSDYLVDQTSSFGYILPMLTLTLAGVYILRRTEQPDALGDHASYLRVRDDRRILDLPIFICGIITIILFYGGYRYINFSIIPLAVIGSWTLSELAIRFPKDIVVRSLWRAVIYLVLYIWAITNLRSVRQLSGVFPVIWGT